MLATVYPCTIWIDQLKNMADKQKEMQAWEKSNRLFRRNLTSKDVGIAQWAKRSRGKTWTTPMLARSFSRHALSGSHFVTLVEHKLGHEMLRSGTIYLHRFLENLKWFQWDFSKESYVYPLKLQAELQRREGNKVSPQTKRRSCVLTKVLSFTLQWAHVCLNASLFPKHLYALVSHSAQQPAQQSATCLGY